MTARQELTIPRQPELRLGSGRVAEIVEIARSRQSRGVAIVTGGRSVRGKAIWSDVTESLLGSGIEFLDFTVRGEPSPDVVDRFRDEVLRDLPGCDLVVAIGGGSVIDAGKALAGLLGMERGSKSQPRSSVGSVARFLEGVGDTAPSGDTLPLIAVPTTAGTGSEATKNAVLSSVGPAGYKKSLRHDNFIPHIAIIDPELHLGCSEEVTRASGLDAITQLIEVFLSSKSNRVIDALALEGLRHAGEAFPALMNGEDRIENRRAMAIAAYLSGVGLAAVGLGVVHGIASPLGAVLPIPHGVVCGATLAPSIRYTLDDAGADAESITQRYGQVALALGIATAPVNRDDSERLVEVLSEWAAPLPRFSTFGLKADAIPELAQRVGMKNHPITLTVPRVETILRDAL